MRRENLLCHVFATIGAHSAELDAVGAGLLYLCYCYTVVQISLCDGRELERETYSALWITAFSSIFHCARIPSTLDSNLVGKVLVT